MWFEDAVIYQIYPLGLCGAPLQNDGVEAHRILRVLDWVEHIKRLGADCVLFNPLFESDAHGYDTRDYRRVDTRLGTNEDLKTLCGELHRRGLRVLFDGVFSTPRAFGCSLTECSTMWAGGSGPLRTCGGADGTAPTGIGSTCPLTGTPAITTASGMSAGRAVRSWSS